MKLKSKMIAFVAILALAVVPAVALAHGQGSTHRHYPGPHSSLHAKKHAYGKVCAATYSKTRVTEDSSVTDTPGEDKTPMTDTDGDRFSPFVNCVVTAAKAAHSHVSAHTLCKDVPKVKDSDGDYATDVASGGDTTSEGTSDTNEANEASSPYHGNMFTQCVHTMKTIKYDIRHGITA